MPSGDGPGMTGGLREASAAAREFALGRTQVALGHLVTLPAACTNDTVLALRVGALQAWFGQDKEFADTCRRALDFATGTSDPPTAERTAKICCLRPTQTRPGWDPRSLSLARRWISARTRTGFPGSRWPSAWPNTAVVISRRPTPR